MKTFLLSAGLLVTGWFVWKVSLFVLNIAGLPGALVGWGASDKARSTGRALQFLIAVIISAIGQSYVYLMWVALVVNFTKHQPDAFGPVIWPVAFVASFFPIYLCAAAGTGEAATGQSEWNPQVYAIFYSEVLTVIGFFIFAFFPDVISLGWPWLHYVSDWLISSST